MKRRIDYRNGAVVALILILVGAAVPVLVPDPLCAGDRPAPSKTGRETAAERVLQEVRACVQRGELERSLELLKPYAARPGAFPSHYSDYLVILTWAGRAEEALRRFEALPSSVSRRPYLLRNMAKAYADRGDFGRAAALYGETCRLDPQDESALEGWAGALAAGGDYAQAEQVLEKAAPSAARSLGVQLLKARLLMLQGHFLPGLASYDALMAAQPDQAGRIARARDDLIAGFDAEAQARLLASLKAQAAARGAGPRAGLNYALALALTRRYPEAADYVNSAGWNPADLPADSLYWFAWAEFKAGRPQGALDRFDLLLARQPGDRRAQIGRIYCLAAMGDHSKAYASLDPLQKAFPDDPEVLYAQAYLYERQSLFWEAGRSYERILKNHPTDRTAVRQRLQSLSDLGATTAALQLAERLLPEDKDLTDTLRHAAAVDRIHWEEGRLAAQRLAAKAHAGDARYAFDYIVALSKAEKTAAAVEAYQALLATGASPPWWVQLAAADAFLAEQRPEQALELYNLVLAQEPASWEARMGKHDALAAMRRWREAEAWLAQVEAQAPAPPSEAGRTGFNAEHFDIALARAWSLALQDRYDEAEEAFRVLQAAAPADLEVRNGLAHVHLWRGWPRQAAEDFHILAGLDAAYTPAQTGRALALDRLGQRDRARILAGELLTLHADNKNVQQTHRMLEVEQMMEWRTKVFFQREEDQAGDTRVRSELSAPLTLKTRVTGYLLYSRAWSEEESAGSKATAYFRRAGVGLDHTFNDEWRVRPVFSLNYDDGGDPGGALRIDYTPSDRWALGLFGDSFSSEIAARARAAGIDAALFGGDILFRPSDARQLSAAYTRSLFSDDNARDEFALGYQQNLWAKHDWRMRALVDLYATRNSMGDQTVYFNPERAFSLALTHLTEQTVWSLYPRSFVHRLYLSGGLYQQKGYSGEAIWSVRYEQEHAFSDLHAFKAGLGYGQNVYDGERVGDLRVEVEYQWRF